MTPALNLFGIPRQVELWRQTTPTITGWCATPQPFALMGNIAVSLRPLANPSLNAWIRDVIRTPAQWTAEPLVAAPRLPAGVRLLSLLEHPAQRIARAWLHCINSPLLRATQPLRFVQIWGAPLPDFIRWLMHQDPLGVDPVLRPQWTMLPENAELFSATHEGLEALANATGSGNIALFAPENEPLPELGEAAMSVLRTLYADDFALWERHYVSELPS